MSLLEKRNREVEMARVKNKDIIACEQKQRVRLYSGSLGAAGVTLQSEPGTMTPVFDFLVASVFV